MCHLKSPIPLTEVGHWKQETNEVWSNTSHRGFNIRELKTYLIDVSCCKIAGI